MAALPPSAPPDAAAGPTGPVPLPGLGDWPARHAILAAVGAAAGLVLWAVAEAPAAAGEPGSAPLALAACTFAFALAFTLTRARAGWALGFATAIAALFALLGRAWQAEGEAAWPPLMGALALCLAVPLFQVVRDEGRLRLPAAALHRAAFADAVIGAGAVAFALAVAAVLALWAGLFALIGVPAFGTLFAQGWFVATVGGGALALGVSLLRDRAAAVAALQRVSATVLGVLAPVLAAALLLFLAFLPFTGLSVLWEATRSATPILLSAIVAALVLANAIIADAEAEVPRAPALRLAAAGLGAVMLPLGVVAAVSLGQRVAQHGWSPERLWAAAAIGIALAWGALYALALLRARRLPAWRAAVRRGNVAMVVAMAALALLLASPLVSMERIAAQAQEARLLAGRVAPEDFDLAAVRSWGRAGEAAVARLADRPAPIGPAIKAELAVLARSPLAAGTARQRASRAAARLDGLRDVPVFPAGTPWPEGLMAAMAATGTAPCRSPDAGSAIDCRLWVAPPAVDQPPRAILLRRSCPRPATIAPCSVLLERWARLEGAWRPSWAIAAPDRSAAEVDLFAALPSGRVEVREETRRVLVVDGRRVTDVD